MFRGADTSDLVRAEALGGFAGGVRVAATDFNGDRLNDVAVGGGPGEGTVRVFDPRTGVEIDSFDPYGSKFDGGLFVAANPRLGGGPGVLSVTPTVTVTADVTAILEGGSKATLTLSRDDSSTTIYITWGMSGTASGSDRSFSGSNLMSAGISSIQVWVTATDDTVLEGPETFVFTIQSGTGYIVGSPSQATVLIIDNDGPTPTPTDGSGCDLIATNPEVSGNIPDRHSPSGVRYSDGAVSVRYVGGPGTGIKGVHGGPGTGLKGWLHGGPGTGVKGYHGGPGTGLRSAGDGDCVDLTGGLSWSWTNVDGYAASTLAGDGSVMCELPYMTKDSGSIVSVVSDGMTARIFDGTTPRFHAQETLSHNFMGKEYTLIDTVGNVLVFHNFDFSLPAAKRGQLKSHTDAAGNVTTVTAYTTDGRPSEVQHSVTVGGTTTINSRLYTYLTSGTNAGRISNVTVRRQVGGGSWTTLWQADLDYHDGTGSTGTAGDLKTIVAKDGSGTTIDTMYFRYYTSSSGAGYAGGLKYAFSAESYGRLLAAYATPDSATDAQVDDYADLYFEYDSAKRVTLAVVQGDGCSVCSGGLGTYTYAYSSSSFADGYGNWRTKTIETLPDGNQNIVFTNYVGQVVLHVYKDVVSDDFWKTFFKYDSSGRLVQAALPSAISGYDETTADLLDNQAGNFSHLRDSLGLIGNLVYGGSTTATSSTAGDVAGYFKSWSMQRGESGSAVSQAAVQFISRAGGSATIYAVANTTQYRNDNGTGGQTTSYAYTWRSGKVMADSVTLTLPTVTTAQNGPNSADTLTAYFDSYGRPTWMKDGGGFIRYNEYDAVTGAVTKSIADVDTDLTSDFTGLPSGWSNSSGLHLKTTIENDAIARPTKVTDPNGNITYIVYKDTDHEVRVYRGWDATNNVPTGPTEVYREDRAGSYVETITMSATPSLTSSKPNGTEAISSIQTLSRSYMNAAGKVTHSDAYFNVSGLTYSTSTSLGTENTHFYRTEYQWDEYGQVKRVLSPTDTIYRTVRDGQGRAVSEWVGTDDTPTSGFWSPINTGGTDLVKVGEYEYDGAGVGDSNVTKATAIPGGAAANRVSQFFYDWRNRMVAIKVGVEGSESTSVNRPIVYMTFDNLGLVTKTESFDGDTVSITTTNGVPDAPSSSLRRAQSEASFDEQGRQYQSKVFSVDSSNGNVSSSALTTNLWYGRRGEVIKVASPGGLVVKDEYDGAGRRVKSYTTDGGGDSGYSDAHDVTGDKVLEQVEANYDSNGNVILTTVRQRFHDETGTGALGTPTTGVKARVSYSSTYIDAVNRPTDSMTVGTNAGSAYTRPGTVPTRSDTVLVSSYAYNASGWVESVTDPEAIVGKRFYDNLGQTTKTIENYVNGTPSDADDKTTEFTYDGSGNTLTLKASLTSGYQETKWVYGTASGTSDDITSNDVMKQTQHPDASTGAASSGQAETRTVNALGETKTYTDRNGNVHTLTYDVLGRLTVDAVTTLGSGVDGAVRRVEIEYDGQGNAYKFTNYDAATGGNVVNQVQREFNGLGQMTKEYQEHSGAVNTGTSLKVQYAYTEMASGANHSRLTSMTYPNGNVLTFNYATGLDADISRLSSLSDSTGTLEGYDYLGLTTVVRRAHSQPGIDLTYIKQGAEGDGDAGDKYTGLDRFGRVVDQRWIKTSTGVATDRFQYGHDRNSNRLWRDNLVNAAFGELYVYDDLNQITSMQRGTLNGTKTGLTGAASRAQSWDFDALGNWDSVTTDGNAETRGHNKQNEITSISGLTTPTFDANGNTTKDETGRTFEFDAWNRLVRAKNSGGTTIAEYKYDAMTRRISETKSGTTTDLYYSSAWEVLEERVGGNAKIQYVWSPVYIDALILRDRDVAGDSALEERLWVQQDANWNVTAIYDGSGGVVELYAYDAFGNASIYDASYGARGSSSYAWLHLHQGGRYESATGLHHFRNRDFSATLGRWLRLDPIGFATGDSNHYRSLENSPGTNRDPHGLEPVKPQLNITTWSPTHLSAGDLYIRTCHAPNQLPGFAQYWQQSAKRGCQRGTVGNRDTACTFGDICKMLQTGSAASGGKLKRVVLEGHCGGARPAGPGVMLLAGWIEIRFDVTTVTPELIKCIKENVADDGIIQICSCGHAVDHPVTGLLGWKEQLQLLANKLQRKVCSFAVPEAAAGSTGCMAYYKPASVFPGVEDPESMFCASPNKMR